MVSNARKLKKKNFVQTNFQPVNWERFIIIIIVIIYIIIIIILPLLFVNLILILILLIVIIIIIFIIIIINNMFIMKNLTYFRKTVETGTDPRLPLFTIF